MKATRIGVGMTLVWLLGINSTAFGQKGPAVSGGELQILSPEGKPVGACPLKHTDVEADIAGFVCRVRLTQTFHNPLDKKIEAVYVFPLPQDAAVDDMVMTVGDRRIVGQIKPRDEAQQIYQAARAAGHVASLLDQERPNIFTQSVANIEPGAQVVIEISYVETLKYEDGLFEFVFPMVVGPRYIPGEPTSTIPPVPADLKGQIVELDPNAVTEGPDQPTGSGWAPDTTEVPDASRITPPVVKPGYRAGHDISLTVRIDAGMELFDLQSELHEVRIESAGAGRATVTLANKSEIPNKDFILRYRLATDEIGDAFLLHTDDRGTFFTLVLQPPRRIVPRELVPRELIFVLDTSGSMSGFPIEKAKQVMAAAIDSMHPGDAFNLITFSGDTRILWDHPRPNTDANRAEAQAFLASRRGRGGTEMMKAIDAALLQTRTNAADESAAPIRVVCFMTDGYVGNDMAIIDAVKRNAGTTRVFSFGIGNSVNRVLLDGMAQAGRGEVEYVTLQGQADAAAQRFGQRILAPVLTDIEVDWGQMPVADVYPRRIPDLFSSKPIMIHGRITGEADGTVTLRGKTGTGSLQRQIRLSLPGDRPQHDALASLWARAKVSDLMYQDLAGLQGGTFPEELKSQITALGLQFRLMTQFTSFVAVEEMVVTVGGEPTTIAVPVEMPEGVSYEGVFSELSAGSGVFLGQAVSAGRPAAAMPAFAYPKQVRGVAVEEKVARRFKVPSADVRGPISTDRPEPGEAPGGKLAEPLRDLAEKVAKQGKQGHLTIGKLRVIDYRVDVMIYLQDSSEPTVQALKKLGFIQTGQSKAIHLLIGTMDVRKLEELARLDAVIRVAPVAA